MDQAAATELAAPATAPEWITAPGLVPYQDALDAMRAQAAAIAAGHGAERIWLLEHPPLYTSGTSAKPADLVAPNRFPVFPAGRGGQWTYHGPGQRVAYVMLDLRRPHGSVPARDIRAFVRGLEAWLITALRSFGVNGERREGRVGIWVADPRTGADAKIAAIGVRVTGWVSWHGVSVNVDPALDHFAGIVPCGIAEHGVTSLRALGSSASLADLDDALRRAWTAIF